MRNSERAFVMQYLLRCETPRPGIQFIRLQLITYNWWKKAQHHHFPHLQFPGTRHHPHDPLGFRYVHSLHSSIGASCVMRVTIAVLPAAA